MRVYTAAKATVEADGDLQFEGSVAYASDTNELGAYNGASWDWEALSPETIYTHANLEALMAYFNGSFLETFDALVTSDGATVTMSLEQSGTGDLTMIFSDGFSTLDCTDPVQTIELTAGSDASPQANYVYVLQSTKALAKSTSAWPSAEHIPVGYFLVPSAGFVNTDGVYINQNWNDHKSDANNQGHLNHVGHRIRHSGALWQSGVAGNGTDDYLTPGAGTTDFKSTSGVINQMHEHAFPAFDTSSGDVVLVKNWSGDAYHNITDLFDITDDSTGTTITNNKYFNLICWGVANKTGEPEQIMVNLPSGFYVTSSSALLDSSGYDDYTMPREFSVDSSTGFLICRITIQMGATWTVVSTLDLRGTTPQTATGGATGVVTEFADNAFRVYDETDGSKEIAFQASGITTATTRTLTVQDANGTIELTGHVAKHAQAGADPLTDVPDHDHTGDAGDGAQIDHGAAVTGLGDDDHTQYLLATGSRAGASSGTQDFGSNGITADVIDESTGSAGVTIESLLIKDGFVHDGGGLPGAKAHVDNHEIPDNTNTVVDFDTEEWDTHAFWEGVTNPDRFTCPSGLDGRYVCFAYAFADSDVAFTHYMVQIRKNGTIVSQSKVIPAASTRCAVSAGVEVDLDATDYITVSTYHLGTSAAQDSYFSCSITRVGD
jgi:hypothetical protein